MGARKEDIEEANLEKNRLKAGERGMKFKDRSCTDVICCLIFTVFIFVMIAISAYGFMNGDPVKIMTPFDSDGNKCGYNNETSGLDLTDYPYKFLPPEAIASLASTDDNTVVKAVCVKKCPSEENGLLTDCYKNTDYPTICPIAGYDTKKLITYCVPEYDSAKEGVKELYNTLDEKYGFASHLQDLAAAWKPIVIMGCATIVVTLLYVWLLKYITKPFLYGSLLAVQVLLILAGYWLFKKRDEYPADSDNYKYTTGYAAAVWVVAGLFLIFICCQWKNIALGAAVMEAAAQFIQDNKHIAFVPIGMYLLCVPITAWWAAGSIYVYSMGEPIYIPSDIIATIDLNKEATAMFWVFLFGFFWLIAFIVAFMQFVIAATACMWYFSGDGADDLEFTQ